jgi:hypothetical protein
MSKRARPSVLPIQKGKTRTAKKTGHGTFTFKRHPKSKWVLNGAIKV